MPSGRRLEALVRAFDRELRRLERDAIVRLDGALRLAALRLEEELRRYYGVTLAELRGNRSLLLREARARLLLEQVHAGLDLTTGTQANQVFGQLIGESFDLGARNALEMLSAFQQELVTLSSGARLAVAARATQTSARLAHHGQAFALKAEQLVIDGIVRGRGWGATARELRREVGVTRWKAEQLIRTESVQASDSARRDTYQSNGVQHVQRIGTMDERICPYCAARVGNVYKIDEAPAALHPNDRCYNLPYREEWRELGLTDDEWMRDHRREAIERMQAANPKAEPNYGLAPFERAAGLEKPPRAVWSP